MLEKKPGSHEVVLSSATRTEVVDLNTGAVLVAKPTDNPTPSESEERDRLGALLKP